MSELKNAGFRIGLEVSGSSTLVSNIEEFMILGRSPGTPSTFPNPGASEPVITLKGNPDYYLVVPESCQLLSNADASLFAFFQRGIL